MTGFPAPCTCALRFDFCNWDHSYCPHFANATYREIETGLWELEAEMEDDLDMWASVRAAENEPPLDEGDAAVMRDTSGPLGGPMRPETPPDHF